MVSKFLSSHSATWQRNRWEEGSRFALPRPVLGQPLCLTVPGKGREDVEAHPEATPNERTKVKKKMKVKVKMKMKMKKKEKMKITFIIIIIIIIFIFIFLFIFFMVRVPIPS